MCLLSVGDINKVTFMQFCFPKEQQKAYSLYNILCSKDEEFSWLKKTAVSTKVMKRSL